MKRILLFLILGFCLPKAQAQAQIITEDASSTSLQYLNGCVDTEDPVVTCPVIADVAKITVQAFRTGGNPGDVSWTITDENNQVVGSGAAMNTFGVSAQNYFLPCDANYTFNYTDNSGGSTQNVQLQIDNVTIINLNPIVTGNYPFTVDPCSPTVNENCEAIIINLVPDVSDDCTADPAVTYTLSGATTGSGNTNASGQAFKAGVTTLTYVAVDDEGNMGSCSVDITVSDKINPTANCPSDITVDNDAGQCGANVSFTLPDPTDNCPGVTSAASPASGTFFNTGTTPVTVTATDVGGNTGTCSFNVTVNDTEDPTANCPGTQTVDSDAGQCGANVNFTLPDPTDNCSGAVTIANPPSGSFFNVGTTSVTVTATDGVGNTGRIGRGIITRT